MSKKTEFKKALLEASKWDEKLTEFERTKITFAEARQRVIDRVYDKYKEKIIENKK